MKPPSSAILAAFERFKAAYPVRPVNPWAPARAIFERLVKSGEDADDLVGSARAFAADCAKLKTDPMFIPHARTWLAQRRFEDFAPIPEPQLEVAPPHPLDGLRPFVGKAYFDSWLRPLRVETRQGGLFVIAFTNIARDRVQRDCGPEITEALGAFTWLVERRPAA